MRSSKLLTGIVVGVSIGVIAGILLSPEKGGKTRQKLLDKSGDLGNSLKDYILDLFGSKKKAAKNLASSAPSMSSSIS